MGRNNRSKQGYSSGTPAGGEAAAEELVAGRQVVLEALRHGRPLHIFMAEGLKGEIISDISGLARKKKVPLTLLKRADFQEKAGDISGNQGVAALVPPFRYLSLDELINHSQKASQLPFLIMLDHIEDPQNLGAIIRTADAAGINGLIIPDRRAAGVTPAARKVAAGAAERLPVARVGNLNRSVELLKSRGFWIYGAEARGESPYYSVDYNVPLVLVVGSEGRGISTLLLKNCDLTVSIPMHGPSAGSLNVASAAAVLLYAGLAGRAGWYS